MGDELCIVQVFNRYLQPGGEERSVDRIYRHLQQHHRVVRCFFDSREWRDNHRSPLQQVRGLFYNPESRRRFEEVIQRERPDVAVFHNIYPVGSPSLYHAALRARLPVIQFAHNYRPFSVGGTLYANGQLYPRSLRGHFAGEVWGRAWQGSLVKSALMALMLRHLQRSGWLTAVRAWVGISEFVRDRLVEAGVPAEQVVALRHSWDALAAPPHPADEGYYLFLGRLVDEKGVATLLAGWDVLRHQLGSQTPRLRIAGSGPLEQCVIRAAAENPLIEYAGELTGAAKAAALAKCRAVIIPSLWWEPLGLVTYEAYDYAKPVLAAAAGGLSETVQPGRTGWLHPPGDVTALVRDVQQLEALAPVARQEMGLAGRRWLLENTNPSDWQKAFDSVLRSVHALRETPVEVTR